MKVLIVPVAGKIVKDPSGYRIPPDGRYYSYGPYWIRARARGLIEEIGAEKKKEEIGHKPKKGYYTRKKGT
jgi:hypothetical protein